MPRVTEPAPQGTRPVRSQPLIVELAGPAGAGKTALRRAVGRNPRVCTGVRIDRFRMLPILAFTAVRLTPIALGLLVRRRGHAWSGLVHLMRLRTLPRIIAEVAARGDCDVILLDEGPVFSLGRLSVFQEADRGEGALARAWQVELDRWRALLDAVIWIDAPDAVLSERIRTRPKGHRIKDGTDTEMAGFLGRYRSAYHAIRERLAAGGRVSMVELETKGLAVEVAAERVVAELKRLGMQRRD